MCGTKEEDFLKIGKFLALFPLPPGGSSSEIYILLVP
jgi:hypothetical protein